MRTALLIVALAAPALACAEQCPAGGSDVRVQAEIAACDENGCSWRYRYELEGFEGELSCVVTGLDGAWSDTLEVELQCDAPPGHEDLRSLALRLGAGPGPSETPPFEVGSSVVVVPRVPYGSLPASFAIYDDGGRLLLAAGMTGAIGDITVSTEELCHRDGPTGSEIFDAELRFARGDDEVRLLAGDVETLGPYRVWVREAGGFRNAPNGLWASLTTRDYILLRRE